MEAIRLTQTKWNPIGRTQNMTLNDWSFSYLGTSSGTSGSVFATTGHIHADLLTWTWLQRFLMKAV